MSRRYVLPLLILLALLGTAIFVVVQFGSVAGIRSAEVQSRAQDGESSVAPAGTVLAPASPPPRASSEGGSASTRTSATGDPASAEMDPELRDARWIEGRVVVPEGTPADEHVEIVADGDAFATRPLYRASIEADGSFRVAFAPKTTMGVLLLRARYLYLVTGRVVEFSDPLEKVILTPILGGYLHGRLLVIGSVSAATRSSLCGSRVRVDASGDLLVHRPSTPVQCSAVLSEELEFAFAGIPPGSVGEAKIDAAKHLVVTHDPISVGAGQAAELVLEARIGATVTGRVVDEKGHPFVGVRVRARATDRSPLPGRLAGSDQSAPDGAFAIAGIPPGDWRLAARADGAGGVEVEVGELIDGARRDGIEIVLPRPLRVSGRVAWPDGRPAKGCLVRYAGSEAGRLGFSGSTQCNLSGQFEIAAPADSPLELYASMNAESSFSKSPQSYPTQAQPCSLWCVHAGDVTPGSAETDRLLLTLQPGISITCRVVDESGSPVPHARVLGRPLQHSEMQMGPSGPLFGTFTSDGDYEVCGLYDGEWEIDASASGFAWATPRRVSLPSDVSRIEFVLLRPASVSGVVLDEHGEPVAAAGLTSLSAEPGRDELAILELTERMIREGAFSGIQSDADGRFTLTPLQPGMETVIAMTKEGASGRTSIELHSGESISGLKVVISPPRDATKMK